MNERRPPGATLLHPACLLAVGVLVLNDQVLKQRWPGIVTGKLSDFAGVFVLPLVVQAVYELVSGRGRALVASPKHANHALALGVALTLLGFGLPEIWEPAAWLFRFGLGAAQWPFYVLFGWLGGGPLPPLRPVQAVADPSDLIALPMLLPAWRVGRHGTGKMPVRALASLAALLAVLSNARAAEAAGGAPAKAGEPGRLPKTHDGFYADLEFGTGVLLLSSDASVSNGFRQSVPSSARGAAIVGSLALGGTLQDESVVLGVRAFLAEVDDPAIETLNHRFRLGALKLKLGGAAAFFRHFPDPAKGFNYGAGLGVFRLGVEDEGNTYPAWAERAGGQFGFFGTVETGQGFWIGRQFSAGGLARVLFGRVSNDVGATYVFVPALLASLTWH